MRAQRTSSAVLVAMSTNDTTGNRGTAWRHVSISTTGVLTVADSGQGGFLTNGSIALDTWTFIALGHDGTDTIIYRMAEGGTSLTAVSGNNHGAMTPTEFKVAHNGTQFTDWFDGEMRGLKVWSGVRLSATQILAEAAQFAPVETTNLHAYYQFIDAASILNDTSGNARHLVNEGSGGSWETVSAPASVSEGGGGSGVTFTTGTVSTTAPAPTTAGSGNSPVVASRNIRLMFMGDSITEDNLSWRVAVYDRLVAANFNVTLTGYRVNQFDPARLQPFYHMGCSGQTTQHLLTKYTQSHIGSSAGNDSGGTNSQQRPPLSSYNSDVIVVLLGTNDIAWEMNFAATGTEAAQERHAPLMNAIRAASPNIKIFVLTIPPQGPSNISTGAGSRNRMDTVREWNNEVIRATNARIAAGENVHLIDIWNHFGTNPDPDLSQWRFREAAPGQIHPTQAFGTNLMGPMIATQMIAALSNTQTPAPAPTTGTVATTIPNVTVSASQALSARGQIPAGMPDRLQIGLFEGHDETWPGAPFPARNWMLDSGRPWDVKYRYLVMDPSGGGAAGGSLGWVNNWNAANPANGQFALSHMVECRNQGFMPCFNYYHMHDMRSPNVAPSFGRTSWEADWSRKVADWGIMTDYWAHWQILMERCRDFGDPVQILIEADGFGFLQQQAIQANNNNSMTRYAAVADTGHPALQGLPNTIAGFGQAFLAIRNWVGARNALLGHHVSAWASGTDLMIGSGATVNMQPHIQTVYNFMAPGGLLPNATGSTYDFLVGDPLDRDADTYFLPAADRVGQQSNRWWDPDDNASVNTMSFNRYREWCRQWNQLSGKRWILWQIPLGRNSQRNVNADRSLTAQQLSGYRDNRTEYFFHATLGAARRTRWVEAGVISLQFGAGHGTQTTHYTDGNFIRDNAVFGHPAPRGAPAVATNVPGYTYTPPDGEPQPEPAIGGVASVTIDNAYTSAVGEVQLGAILGTATAQLTTPLVAAVGAGLERNDGVGAATTPVPTVSTSTQASKVLAQFGMARMLGIRAPVEDSVLIAKTDEAATKHTERAFALRMKHILKARRLLKPEVERILPGMDDN